MKRRPRAVSVAPWSLRALVLSPLAWALACDAESSGATAAAVTDACGRYGDAVSDARRLRQGYQYRPEVSAAREAEQACRSALALPDTGATEAAFDACAEALASTASGAVPSACEPSGGGRAVGDSCVSSWQCASGFCGGNPWHPIESGAPPSQVRPEPTCGACIAGPCGEVPCAPGTVCDMVSQSCVAPGSVGASCGAFALDPRNQPLCAEGTSCQGGLCQPLPGEGEPCQGPCAAGLLCGGVCIRIAIVGNGERCGDEVGADCAQGLVCEGHGYCRPVRFIDPGGDCTADFNACALGECSYDGQAGRCPSVVAAGGACTPGDASAICAVGSWCIDGTCQRPENVACE